jgi:hypothetical protein
MPKAKKQSAHLDAVAKARTELVLAKATLEARLREELEDQLLNMQSRLDLTVRYAYDAGHSKAQILQAMGAKYYGIVNESLERTEGVDEVVGVDPLASVYDYDISTGMLRVTYDKHGPDLISGEAEFMYAVLHDGAEVFFSNTPIYNEDYSKKNEVVTAIADRQNGFYYEEALAWVTGFEQQ